MKRLPRSPWKLAAVGVVAGVFVVGLVVIVRGLWTAVPEVVKTATSKPSPTAANKLGEVTTINNASFGYLIPGKDASWLFDDKSTAYDDAHGVVKYLVKLTYAQVEVTISQQAMPGELAPRGSDKFNAFINDSKAVRSQDAGPGKIYFLPTLENGAPSSTSADTVIYATDNILMFGRANRAVRYGVWAQLLASMHAH